jgi:uncharacterized peroxidase-related enzyme
MAHIETPAPDEVDGHAAELFGAARDGTGHVPNHLRLFGRRPAAYAAWQQLLAAIKAAMDARRYELATLAAARRLRSPYCAVAHGAVLRERFYDARTLRRIVADHHDAGLDPADVAVMDFADRIAADATSITAADVAALRAHGLSDADILDVALTAGARCFFAKVLDAMGAEPDPAYRARLEPELYEALANGHATPA